MNEGFELLGTMDEVWAKMFMEVLKDNGIPCTSMPVFGYALTAKTGGSDARKIFVPAIFGEQAKALLEELYSGNGEEALEALFPGEENEQ